MEGMENEGQMPAAVVQPDVVTDSKVEVGYTESDPLGPQKEDGPLLAGKYKTAEELEKAYKELESKLGQPKEDKPVIDPNAPKVAALETTQEATAMLAEKGLDISTFTAEYETTGQLSAASYEALGKAGITRDMVEQYISGQQVLLDSQVREVKESVGGEAEYAKLSEWATVNLTAREQQAYQRILETNDLATIKLAAAGLKARYVAAMGKDPALIVGGNTSGGNDGQERFNSRAEMVSAMQDPRYEKDPAYRARVERKVINSTF